jgi:hypothetical protein
MASSRHRLFYVFLQSVALVALLHYTAAQTQKVLDAPVVKSQVVIRWNASAKAMQWAVDDKPTFHNIAQDTLFLAKSGIYITYPRLNPLLVQATASVTAVEDPGFTAVSKLIDAITSVTTTVSPTAIASNVHAARLPGAGMCTDPATDIGDLDNLLYGPNTQPQGLKDDVPVWISEIDDGFTSGEPGWQAVGHAITEIKSDSKTIQDAVDTAKVKLAIIQQCIGTPGGVYAAALLSNPSLRIQQLVDIAGMMTKLADQIHTQYADKTKWTGTNSSYYLISDEVIPTLEKMQNVTVKVVNIAFNVSASSSVTIDQPTAGSATFSVRRYSSLTPEIGVGAVFATVTQPVFGTAQNATGQMIVAKKPDKSVSVSPTVLVNFVCRCGTGLLTPMAQIGAAASKDVPGILLGGGVRLFGLSKGDIAVGGGAMFAWVKDLQKLKVGDVITGTNDINSDLSFNSRPKVGGYFAIQYKF